MKEEIDNADIVHVCEEMSKAIVYASKRHTISTFSFDVPRSLIELHRILKVYKKKEETENNGK